MPEGHYRVRPGDTFLAIARRVGRKHSELQAWNALSDANLIKVDQILRVAPPPTSDTPSPTQAPSVPLNNVEDRVAMKAPSRTDDANTTLPPPPRFSPAPKAVAGYTLQWPASGKVVHGYGTRGSKGLNIEGISGDAIYASHDGRVAYSGQLRGYGTIVLIKGSHARMTAYAQLGEATAKEGQLIRQGDRIGFFRRVAKGTSTMYFELRQDEKPINPMTLLPPQ